MTAERTAKTDGGGGPPDSDERVRRQNWLQQSLTRPSSGAMLAALVAFLVFSWPLWECVADVSACYGRGFLSPRGIANWLDVAAQVGILGAAVTLLMIAGEFDLSVGSMIGAAGMVIAIGMDVYGLPPFLAVAAAFAFALAVGFFNGWLVTKTALPSFIVTLGMLFLLRGVTIGLTRLSTPITYISDPLRSDPFRCPGSLSATNQPDRPWYVYQRTVPLNSVKVTQTSAFSLANGIDIKASYPGPYDWFLISYGPNAALEFHTDPQLTAAGLLNNVYLPYDPTNGTTSAGDIYRFGPD